MEFISESDVLIRDEKLIAVNKPVNLPVHKNDHMRRDHPYLLKSVGAFTEREIYPVHRLDAKTTGVILMAFDRSTAGKLSQQFRDRTVRKVYHAWIKGDPGEGMWDDPVLDRTKKQRVNASTVFETVVSYSTGLSYKTTESPGLSLIKLMPLTGRWHQLRQHLSMRKLDIIGDTQHGDWTLNKIITARTGIQRLFLHSSELSFTHPDSGELCTIKAPIPKEFTLLEESIQAGVFTNNPEQK